MSNLCELRLAVVSWEAYPTRREEAKVGAYKLIAINIMKNVNQQWLESALDLRVRLQTMLLPEGLVFDTINHRFETNQKRHRCVFGVLLGRIARTRT